MNTATTQPQLSLSLRGVRFGYGEGQFQLSVPELDIPGGRAAVCIGPSGSGKTTLLQLMAGIFLPEAGTVSLGDVRWDDLSEADRRLRRITHVGLVFQEFELLEHLTVRENILLPYFIQGGLALDDQAEATAHELAGAAGIEDLLARKPQALSQGERQRVALCRALVTRPQVLLADEPTGNLDPKTTEAVLELLVSQARQRQATLVMVTHDHSLLESFDQVIEFSIGEHGASAA